MWVADRNLNEIKQRTYLQRVHVLWLSTFQNVGDESSGVLVVVLDITLFYRQVKQELG